MNRDLVIGMAYGYFVVAVIAAIIWVVQRYF